MLQHACYVQGSVLSTLGRTVAQETCYKMPVLKCHRSREIHRPVCSDQDWAVLTGRKEMFQGHGPVRSPPLHCGSPAFWRNEDLDEWARAGEPTCSLSHAGAEERAVRALATFTPSASGVLRWEWQPPPSPGKSSWSCHHLGPTCFSEKVLASLIFIEFWKLGRIEHLVWNSCCCLESL